MSFGSFLLRQIFFVAVCVCLFEIRKVRTCVRSQNDYRMSSLAQVLLPLSFIQRPLLCYFFSVYIFYSFLFVSNLVKIFCESQTA